MPARWATSSLHLNGRRVGNDYFSPGWTDYNKRVYYNTYDVTELVKSRGPTPSAAILAAGWYAGRDRLEDRPLQLRHRPAALRSNWKSKPRTARSRPIATDGSWKTAWGPYLEGEFLAGETYDARKEIPGWDRAGLRRLRPGSRWP